MTQTITRMTETEKRWNSEEVMEWDDHSEGGASACLALVARESLDEHPDEEVPPEEDEFLSAVDEEEHVATEADLDALAAAQEADNTRYDNHVVPTHNNEGIVIELPESYNESASSAVVSTGPHNVWTSKWKPHENHNQFAMAVTLRDQHLRHRDHADKKGLHRLRRYQAHGVMARTGWSVKRE